jgi:hypothetical protein
VTKLLDAIEAVGEAVAEVGSNYANVYISVPRDADVDRVYALLGKLVDSTESPYVRAPHSVVFDGNAWRQAETLVAGVRVTVTSTHRQLDAIGSLDLDCLSAVAR